MVRPDIVVQLQDGSKYHNMPLVTPEFVIETQHWPSGVGDSCSTAFSLRLPSIAAG